ncbi:MAG: hypothetical protein HY865_26120 [Chloroflexi bacterium]|nr:hypothetical protein [Chloroflexota bacterium]
MNNQTLLTKSEIFTVYNQMRAAARREGNTKQIERLNKALGILLSKEYYAGERLAYIPTKDSCGCKDWEFRFSSKRAYTGGCKHMLAEVMMQSALALRAAHEVTVWLTPRESFPAEVIA